MSQKPETQFREKVYRQLKHLPRSWFESIQQVAICGTPDMLGVVNGFMVALEFKIAGNKADPLQEHKLKRIRDSGGIALVVTPEEWPDQYAQLVRICGMPNFNPHI